LSLLDRLQAAKFWQRAEELPPVQPTQDISELCGLLRELIELHKEHLEASYLILKSVAAESFNDPEEQERLRNFLRNEVRQL
jgi:hypothetical protein